MGEVGTKEIEIEVNQEKINHISYAYNEEVTYWKSSFGEGFKWERRKRIGIYRAFKSFVD